MDQTYVFFPHYIYHFVLILGALAALQMGCAKSPSPSCVNNDGCTVFAEAQSLGICEDVRCMGGECTVLPQLSGTPCDDGDACTSGDFCAPGAQCTAGPQWVCGADSGADVQSSSDTDSQSHIFEDSNDSMTSPDTSISMSEAIVISDTNHAVNYPPVIIPNSDGTATAYYAAMDEDFTTSSIRARPLDSTGSPTGPSTEIHLHQGAAFYPSSASTGFSNFLTLYNQGANELQIWLVDNDSAPQEKASLPSISSSLTSTAPFFSSVMVSYLSEDPSKGGSVVHISSDNNLNPIFNVGRPSPIHIIEYDNQIFGVSQAEPDGETPHMRLYNLSDSELPHLILSDEHPGSESAGIAMAGEGEDARIYVLWSQCGESSETLLFSADTSLSSTEAEASINSVCADKAQRLPLVTIGTSSLFTAWFEDGDLLLSTFETGEKAQLTERIEGFQNQVPSDLFMANAPTWASAEKRIFWPGVVASSETGRVYDAVLWRIQVSAD